MKAKSQECTGTQHTLGFHMHGLKVVLAVGFRGLTMVANCGGERVNNVFKFYGAREPRSV